jgi:hypothetical protein
VIHFRHVTKELFPSVTLFCLANLRPQRSETPPRLSRTAWWSPGNLSCLFDNVIETHEHAGDFRESNEGRAKEKTGDRHQLTIARRLTQPSISMPSQALWLRNYTVIARSVASRRKNSSRLESFAYSMNPARRDRDARISGDFHAWPFACCPIKGRSGLPRVRTAHNRELIHRSAGEKLCSRSVFISAVALLKPLARWRTLWTSRDLRQFAFNSPTSAAIRSIVVWRAKREHAGDFREPWSGLANVQPFRGYSLYGARNRLQDAI